MTAPLRSVATLVLLGGSAGTCRAAEVIVDNPILAGMRFSERLIVAGSGVLALWLGFKLFSKAADRASEAGTMVLSLGDRLKLQMESIGPGVFFALFGTAILIYVMSSQVQLNARLVLDDGKSVEQRVVMGAMSVKGLSPPEFAAQQAYAIKVLSQYATSGMTAPTPAGQQRLRTAVDELDGLMSTLVDTAVGERGAYAYWKSVRPQESAPNFRNSLPNLDRERLEKVDKVLIDETP